MELFHFPPFPDSLYEALNSPGEGKCIDHDDLRTRPSLRPYLLSAS